MGFLSKSAALAVAAAMLAGAAAPSRELTVQLHGLRNAKGNLLLCLTASAKHFPDCKADAAARTLSIPANRSGPISFAGISPGNYALSVMHDENGNQKLDTALKIPREGFGFSRNPVVRFGPPKYRDVRFAMPGHATTIAVRMKYLL